MKRLELPRFLRSRFAVAILAGVLLALAFPRVGIAGFAWIGPGVLALAARGKTGWEAFRIGYVGGLAYYLVSLNWLLRIPYRWYGIPIGPSIGLLALSAFLAIYPGIWLWLISRVGLSSPLLAGGSDFREGAASSPENQAPMLAWAQGTAPLASSWAQRSAWALGGAAAWVAIEMCIARLLSGFPWDLLGVSQYRLVPLIQIASITGVYGVSFVVVWTSLSLLLAAVTVLERPTMRYAWLSDIVLPLATVFGLFMWGAAKMRHGTTSDEPPRTLRVTFIQPSIPQTLIWDQSRDQERFQEIIQLTSDALTNKTDLVLWPEAAVPGLLRYRPEMYDALAGLAKSNHVWMIVGADDAERKEHPVNPEDAYYFNSSFLISPDGLLMARYRKRNLVIFGEYTPLANFLPFVRYLTPWIGEGFTPGRRVVAFQIPALKVKTSPLICFEDVFPHLAREYATDDTDFLVNLTNNGWFGEGAAQWQHGTTALFRAVENGLPLLRCSNNGLTCWVDQFGRVRQIFRDAQGTIYGKGFMTAQIPLLDGTRNPTFYNQHGDWFGWGCVVITVLNVVLRTGQRRITKPLP